MIYAHGAGNFTTVGFLDIERCLRELKLHVKYRISSF